MTEENTNINQKEKQTEQPRGDEKGEKLFTQEEVNKIVSERLKRQEKRDEKRDKNEAEKALEVREQELDSRGKKLDCKEYLLEKKYPLQILELIDTSDVEVFKEKADTIRKMITDNRYTAPPVYTTEPSSYRNVGGFDSEFKHKPKKFGGMD